MCEDQETDSRRPELDTLSEYYDAWFQKVDERFAVVGYSPSDRFNEIVKQRLVTREILELIQDPDAGTWLDYGCGRAYLFKDHDIPLHCRCIGIDVADRIIQENRVAFADRENFEFHEAASGFLGQLDDESVDLVTMLEVIEHVYGADHVVANLARVLKVGGKIVITTPNRARAAAVMRKLLPLGWSRYLEDRNDALGIDELENEDRDLASFEVKTHFHEFTMPELKRLLRSAGFEITAAHRTAIKIMPNRSFNFLASRWPRFVERFAALDYSTRTLPIGFFKMGMLVVARKVTTDL